MPKSEYRAKMTFGTEKFQFNANYVIADKCKFTLYHNYVAEGYE